ncbi:hypothetical protein E2C01_030625 [Portunus trituberculatus]|uniref:Uncharacterized protein n=1 Tax=Portunus trituberculatus TaxID=210409 RepID=A0A5B7ERB4_PORTR|nr:hypothetical protein [Portunus trituberculatus]
MPRCLVNSRGRRGNRRASFFH